MGLEGTFSKRGSCLCEREWEEIAWSYIFTEGIKKRQGRGGGVRLPFFVFEGLRMDSLMRCLRIQGTYFLTQKVSGGSGKRTELLDQGGCELGGMR